jgi:type IV pilus assembly protein PilP
MSCLDPSCLAPVRLARPVRLGAAGLLLLLTLLSGCGGEQQELQDWMDQQRREVRPSVPPLAAPKKFNPVPYANAQQVDPFSTQKLSVALKQEARQPNSMLAAEMSRRKEPLESFPLDAMAMVGSVAKAGAPVALLRVDNLLYQVKAGDHLGQNYGRVLRISETEVVLREIVQDAAGEWIERNATLQLQERGQEAGK